MNPYRRRLMVNHAIQTWLAEENIQLNFDVPTDIELAQLGFYDFEDDDHYEGAA